MSAAAAAYNLLVAVIERQHEVQVVGDLAAEHNETAQAAALNESFARMPVERHGQAVEPGLLPVGAKAPGPEHEVFVEGEQDY